MSLTSTKPPLINQPMTTLNGLEEANITVKSLSIKTQKDGSKTLFVVGDGHEILFTLTSEHCKHLAALLTQ